MFYVVKIVGRGLDGCGSKVGGRGRILNLISTSRKQAFDHQTTKKTRPLEIVGNMIQLEVSLSELLSIRRCAADVVGTGGHDGVQLTN